MSLPIGRMEQSGFEMRDLTSKIQYEIWKVFIDKVSVTDFFYYIDDGLE